MGKRIKALRRKMGITQGQLAAECQCSITTISSIEQGVRDPSIKLVCKLSEVLEATIDYIVKG